MNNPNNPLLESFVKSAQKSIFPIQNLPYGVFSTPTQPPAIGVAIGDEILNISVLESEGILKTPGNYFSKPNLNQFLKAGKKNWQNVRQQLSELLRKDNQTLQNNKPLCEKVFVNQSTATMHLPMEIGDYTDFYSSESHARNIGMMFRDKNSPLLPNWKHLPVGYHGRASSVVVSKTPIKRPFGQVAANPDGPPSYQATSRLDFELELAFVVGSETKLGEPIVMEKVLDHIFGFVLLNDWSARDIQRWEYVPLGPFISKSFATSISPWVVTYDALEPFFIKGVTQDPEPLDYLKQPKDFLSHLDVELSVFMKTKQSDLLRVSKSNGKHLYWSFAQQLVHHTVGGCNVRPGDLMASGTISGDSPDSYGSLIELTTGGQKPLTFGDESRTFLQEGDFVRMSGVAKNKDYQIGFGCVDGEIVT